MKKKKREKDKKTIMATINLSSLESLQHFRDGGRYTSPKDHPAERHQDNELVCPYCVKTIMDDDHEMCSECRMAEAEYREER